MNLTTTDQLTGKILGSIRRDGIFDRMPFRAEALDVFQSLGVPHAKHEEYKHTPIARYLDKNFDFGSPAKPSSLDSVEAFLIPGLESNKLVFVNGIFSETLSAYDTDQIQVQRLEDAVLSGHTAAIHHFGKYANFTHDGMTAWNTAAWSHGSFIYVGDNIAMQKPVTILNIVDASAGEVNIINRNLFVVGRSAQLTIIEKHDSIGTGNHFTNQVNEFVVQENAGLEYYVIQNDLNNRYQHSTTVIYQRNASRVNTYTFTLEGKFYRNNLQLLLDGEGIESHMYGLYLIGKDTLADNHTVVDHMKPNSFSNEIYKGIMDENSRGVFNGKIFVRPQAQKTNAFQANRNILLTNSATVNTKPQLEIWADDVKCSHGCTTGQIDEEALFYLQSRGINKDTAKAMMLYAFAGDVLEHVPHPAMKAYLDGLISDRLHKNF